MIPGPAEVYGTLDSRYPFHTAYDWDNSGWQVRGTRPISRCLVALDPSEAALEEARSWDAQLLLTHHPLYFPHIRGLDPDDRIGRMTAGLLASEIGLLASHTCADRHLDGVSGALADLIGLEGQRILAPDGEAGFYKLVTFVPGGHLEAVRNALAAAGAGEIGDYTECSFTASGRGTYRPQEGAEPMAGEVDRLEEATEERLEMRVEEGHIDRVLEALFEAHPYDEAAYDLFESHRQGDPLGMGVIGHWQRPLPLEEALNRLKEALLWVPLGVTGPEGGEVGTVAVAGGSASGLIAPAHARGAELFVGGDLKYHDLLEHTGRMVCVDPGHRASEQPGVERLAETLGEAARERSWELEVRTFHEDPALSRTF
ncbi:MAG: Nif3-like dinuclear metal center hexameric protein [bacterium]